MGLTRLTIFVFCCQSAMGMQMNARNLRHQDENNNSGFCEMFANASAAARELCGLLSDPGAVADFEAYRELVVDEQAAIDSQNYYKMHSNDTDAEHIRKLLADRQLLKSLQKFQQLRERYGSKAKASSQASRIVSSSTLQPKGNHSTGADIERLVAIKNTPVSLTSIVVGVPISLLIVYGCIFSFGSIAAWYMVHQHKPAPKEGRIDVDAINQHVIAKQAFVAIVAVFLAIRLCFRIQETVFRQGMFANFGTYGSLCCLVVLVVLVVILRLVTASIERKEAKPDELEVCQKIKRKCPTCNSYSCYIRHR